MNLLYRFYCRTFQGVLKALIPVLPYREPQLLHSTTEVPDFLRERKVNSVLVVTDSSIHKAGLLESLKQCLEEQHLHYVVYDQTTVNPTIQNVEEAAACYREHHCEALIGFGGGSSIDCAKAVGARIARPGKSIQKMRGILKILRPIPLLIAVPTTAGTGSETTLATVITDEESGHKFPINDFVLIPDAAVLDPRLTKSLPKMLTATTGMDALTHAVEAYIGRSATAGTRKAAKKAAYLIAQHLEEIYRDGENMTARKKMLQAAFLAGRAFTVSYVGYCHAVAHSLGGEYHIPHGLANAVLLPYVLEAYGEAVYKKLSELAVAMQITEETVSEEDAAKTLIAYIRKMNASMGIPETLSGIRTEDISRLAARAAKEANPLYPVPILMGKKELEQFYYNVMEKKA